MEKHIIIDSRMRSIEKEYIKGLGYQLIELPKSINTYDEIASHVDIFCTQIADQTIFEKQTYQYFKENVDNGDILYQYDVICGKSVVQNQYPFDIPYNVCQIGKKVVHHFKYTDPIVLSYIEKSGLEKIAIQQGYSNCSIAVINDNSCIVTDESIANVLLAHDIDVLCVEKKLPIYLLNEKNQYSSMQGFIGGCISRIEDKIVIFGDLSTIDKENQIKNFIESKNLQIVDFSGLDVIDYGGILILRGEKNG